MTKKVSELSGAVLDYWVARALVLEEPLIENIRGRLVCQYVHHHQDGDDGWWTDFMPSKDWEQGGPIIERESIGIIRLMDGEWSAGLTYEAPYGTPTFCGATPLEAAMRCFVASRLGEEVNDAN